MTSWIPKQDAAEREQDIRETSGIELVQVTESPANYGHIVQTEVIALDEDNEYVGEPTPMYVTVAQRGDVNVPSPGDMAVAAETRGGQYICLGIVYTSDASLHPQSYTAAKRIVGHPLSTSRLEIAEDESIKVAQAGGSNIDIAGGGKIAIEERGADSGKIVLDTNTVGGDITIDSGDADGGVDITVASGRTISLNGSVQVNGGTNPVLTTAASASVSTNTETVVTDVTTTTDADGHVTSVNVTSTDITYVTAVNLTGGSPDLETTA